MLGAIRNRLAALDTPTLILLLAAAAIGGSIIKDLLLLAFDRDDEFRALAAFLTAHVEKDSWRPMWAAVEVFRSAPDAGIYQTIFFDQNIKFQYPPTSLLPLVGLDLLGVDGEVGAAIFKVVLLACVVGVIAVSAKLALMFRDAPALTGVMSQPLAPWRVAIAAVIGTLSYYPIMYAIQLGQIQLVIDLAICVAVWAWLQDRKGVAGATMALAALIKPHYALVFVWALLRREHRFAKGFALAGIPAGLLSLLVFGVAEHIAYLKALSFMGRHGEVHFANQSMNGLLNRLFTDVDSMTFSANSFAPYSPLVYAGTLLSTLALLGIGLFYRPRWLRGVSSGTNTEARTQEAVLDLSTVIVALTLASPIAWRHHYGVFWPIMIVALVIIIQIHVRRADRLSVALLGLLGASYLLVSNYLTMLLPFVEPPLNLAQSHFYFGGLMLLAALTGARAALDPAADAEAARSRSAA